MKKSELVENVKSSEVTQNVSAGFWGAVGAVSAWGAQAKENIQNTDWNEVQGKVIMGAGTIAAKTQALSEQAVATVTYSDTPSAPGLDSAKG